MSERSKLANDLATQLAPVARSWRQLADRILASLAISNSAGWALVRLKRLGAGTRQADLARAIGITEASLTTTIRQLEATGLVERLADEQDRRANPLHLTQEGTRIARKADARLVALRAELLDGIPDADLETTVRVIGTIGARVADMRART